MSERPPVREGAVNPDAPDVDLISSHEDEISDVMKNQPSHDEVVAVDASTEATRHGARLIELGDRAQVAKYAKEWDESFERQVRKVRTRRLRRLGRRALSAS